MTRIHLEEIREMREAVARKALHDRASRDLYRTKQTFAVLIRVSADFPGADKGCRPCFPLIAGLTRWAEIDAAITKTGGGLISGSCAVLETEPR
jgi:hypothetical protein